MAGVYHYAKPSSRGGWQPARPAAPTGSALQDIFSTRLFRPFSPRRSVGLARIVIGTCNSLAIHLKVQRRSWLAYASLAWEDCLG